MKKIITTTSASQTQKIGEEFAKKIKAPAFVALFGDLGSGKTTFLQGFAKGLGVKEKILSPTFVILKRFGNFYHIDCYRINSENDLLELNFKEIISGSKNIVAVEWPDKIKKIIPKNAIHIKFEFINENKRKIIFENGK